MVSVTDQDIIGRITNWNIFKLNVAETQRMLVETWEASRRVEEYTKPPNTVERVGDHPVQMIALQVEIKTLKTQTFPPPEFDHTKLESLIQMLKNIPDDTRQ